MCVESKRTEGTRQQLVVKQATVMKTKKEKIFDVGGRDDESKGPINTALLLSFCSLFLEEEKEKGRNKKDQKQKEKNEKKKTVGPHCCCVLSSRLDLLLLSSSSPCFSPTIHHDGQHYALEMAPL